MINEIRKRLGRSEKVKLECIDKNGFLYYEAGHNLEEKKRVLESSLVIDLEKSKWGNYFFIEGSDSFVAGAELKYFRIKEQDKEREVEEFELKAGDKVFIREDLEVGIRYGDLEFLGMHIVGVHDVIGKTEQGNYYLNDDHHNLYYSPKMVDWDKTREMNTKQQYDFKDLVHFSEKAVRDGVLKEMKIEYGVLTVITHKCGYLYSVSDHATSDFIDSCMDSLKQEYKKQGVEFGELGKLDFNDLIDVAVQAVKDDLLEINRLGTDFITANIPGNSDFVFLTSYRDKSQNFKSDIDAIKSLYKETFKVESMEDIDRVKWVYARATLSNGCDLDLDVMDCAFTRDVMFSLLKGATITQKRGK